jgi:hypothetical protein
MGIETLVTVIGVLLLLILLAGLARLKRKVGSDPYVGPEDNTSQPRTPIEIDENVQITVYRRSVVQPERWYPLLAFAHLAEPRLDTGVSEPDPVLEVHRQGRQMLGDNLDAFQSLTSDSRSGVVREGELRFVPKVEGIEFNPAERRFVWRESVHCEQFRMRAAASADGKTVRGMLTVFSGNLLIADVPLNIRVAKDAPETYEEQSQARPYRRIFASYSHRDLDIVQEFERHAKATGDSYLRDAVSLRSGERWNDQILEMINRADVFQLFWSWNAMASQFVTKEWEYALSLNRKQFVRPVYWDEPLPEQPGLPPDSLRSLHFQRVYPRSASSGIEQGLSSQPQGDPAYTAAKRKSRDARPSSGSSMARMLRVAAIVTPVLALALYVAVSNRSLSFPVPPPSQTTPQPSPNPPANPVVEVPIPVPSPPPPAGASPSVTPPPPAPPVELRPGGTSALKIEEVTLRGIIQVRGEFVGLLEAVDGKTYMLRQGDRMFDGVVSGVNAESVSFIQEVNDPLSLVRQREVRKTLRPR